MAGTPAAADPRCWVRSDDAEAVAAVRAVVDEVAPDLVVTYRPRSTLGRLADQYFNYGRWRRVVARRHPGTANARYLAPPTMVVGTLAATALGLAWRPALLVPTGYAAAVTAGGWLISKGEDPAVRVRVPAAIATMHWSWGVGFLTSPSHLSQGLPDGA